MKLIYSFLLSFIIFPLSLLAADMCSPSDYNVTLTTSDISFHDNINQADDLGKLFYIKVGIDGETDYGNLNINLADLNNMRFEYSFNSCPLTSTNTSLDLNISFADALAAGDHDLNLRVYNNQNSTSKDYDLTLTWLLPLPPVVNIPDQSAISGFETTIDITSYVTDPNGDNITSYQVTSGLQPGITFNNGIFDLNGSTPTGSYEITVTATDDTNRTSEEDTFTLLVQTQNDIFCYGYSYTQQGLNFTEINDGSQLPRLTGEVAINEPINMSLYVQHQSNFEITDLSISVADMNASQVAYIPGTTGLVDIGDTTVTSIPDSATNLVDISIGSIDPYEYFYVYYDLNPLVTTLSTPIDVNLTFTLDGSTTQTFGSEIQMCNPSTNGGDYDATYSIFNVEHIATDGYQKYNLPTQIVKRSDNFKVVSYNVDETHIREDRNASVFVELINIGEFSDVDTDCYNPQSSISEKILVTFNNSKYANFNASLINQNSLNVNTTDVDFYRQANENTAFRISYNVIGDEGALVDIEPSGTGWIVKNFTDLASGVASANADLGLPVNEQNKCKTPVVVGNHTYTTMPSACGNASDTNSISTATLAICMECVYGFNTRYVCSRDNFAIRPESFLIKIDDQNQTLKTSQSRLADNVSGTATPTTEIVNMAAGYDYELETTATSAIDSNASFGYTTVKTIKYIWEPRVSPTPTGCIDQIDKPIALSFSNGFSSNPDVNVSQVGEYRLNLTDSLWTNVDQNPTHHTGIYFNAGTNVDCLEDTSSVTTVGSNTVNGCNISSSHTNNNITPNIIYNDYNVTLHPYKFDLTDVNSTVGLNNDPVDANSSIYMADINKSQEMSYHLDGNIRASGWNDSNLSNFTAGCYAKAIDINVTKSAINTITVPYRFRFNALDINGIILSAQNGDLNNTVGTIQLSEGNFSASTLGALNSNLNMNFHRENNNSVNPQEIFFDALNVDCTNANADCQFSADLITTKTTQGSKDLNSSIGIKHYYGRTNVPRQRFIGSSGNSLIYYEAFCSGNDSENVNCDKSLLRDGVNSITSNDPRWFINQDHNSSFGIVEQEATINQKNASKVSGTGHTGNHQDSTNLVYTPTSATSAYPYKATMENNASSWLIYNKYNIDAVTNEFEVEFLGGTGAWVGENETNTTTDSDASQRTNRRSMW